MPFKFSYNEKRVHAQLMELAGSNGLIAISIRKLGLLLGLNEVETAAGLNVLREAGAIAIEKPSHDGRPKTYHVVRAEELLAQQPSNVILFAPYLEAKRRAGTDKKRQKRKHDLCG
jgi:hypothetical protein